MKNILRDRSTPGKLVLIAAALGASLNALAITSTDTLPKGVRAAAFVYGFGDGINSNISSDGRLESLVKPLNRSITFDDMAGYAPELRDLQSALNALGPDRLGDQIVAANLYSDINVRQQQFVPALLWGLSDHFSLGVRVPILQRQYTVNFSQDIVNNAAALKQAVGKLPRISEGLDRVATELGDPNFFSNYIFTKHGYQTPKSFSAQGLGDIEFESRYKLYEGPVFVTTLRGNVRLPTSTYRPDITNIVDRDLMERNYWIKVGPAFDVRLIPNVLTFRGGIFGTYRAPSHVTRALPHDPSAPLADLTLLDASGNYAEVENVYRKLGNQIDTDFGLMLDVWKGVLSFSASYDYTVKGRDVYRGTKGLDYERLMADTDAIEHGIELSGEISSVPLFTSNRLPLPGKVVATWYQPFKGKNTLFAPYGRFDVIVLF